MPYETATLVSAVYLYMFIYLLFNNLWILLAGILASQKGRSVGGWITGAIFLGLIAVIILVTLPDLNQPQVIYRTRTIVSQNSTSNASQPNANNSTASCAPNAPQKAPERRLLGYDADGYGVYINADASEEQIASAKKRVSYSLGGAANGNSK